MDMKHLIGVIRYTIQIVTLILFIYQSILAVGKYLEYPMVAVRSQVKITELTKPRLLVCSKSDNFNYTYATSIGYHSYNDFVSGKVVGYHDRLSWVGNTSLTFKEIEELIYIKHEYNITIKDIAGETMTKVKIMNFNNCYEIHNFTKELTLVVSLPSLALFVDPNSSIFHRLGRNIVKGTNINIGNKINEGDTSYYLLQLSRVKRSSKTFFCKEHKQEQEFAQCVNNNLQESFRSLLGCLPPWIMNVLPISKDLDQCSVKLKVKEAKEKSKILRNFIGQTRYQSQVDLESPDSCAPPCTHMVIDVVQTYYNTGNWSHHWIHFLFDENANVFEDVNNYDEFSLIVEVGSSLSLWIGLSALAVFDLLMEIVQNFSDMVIRCYLNKGKETTDKITI